MLGPVVQRVVDNNGFLIQDLQHSANTIAAFSYNYPPNYYSKTNNVLKR